MRTLRFNAFCTTALVLIGGAAPGKAQSVEAAVPAAAPADDNSQLSDIVVTAQKRSENLQRVPIAITAVAPAALTAAGVVTVQDLGNVVPGLKFLNIGGQVTPRIRGIGSTSTAPGQEAPVSVVVDGVYYASNSDVSADLPDVAQIAVLKGPQGTLFGRNATGGVIQINTRDPKAKTELDLSTSIDNYLTSRSTLYLGGPVSQNVKAGISLQYVTQGNGWGTNIFNGEDVHKIKDSLTARAKLIIDLGADTTLRLNGDYAHREGSTSGAYTVFPGFVQRFPSPIPSRLWDINSYIQPLNRYSGGGGSATLEHDFGFARFTSISGYRDSKQLWRFNPAVTAVPSLDLELHDSSRQFTQEFQLVSPSHGPFTWTVGAFYINLKGGQDPQTVNLQPAQRGPGPFSQINTITSQNMNSVAGFAQATYAVTPSTRLTGGIRYTWEEKTLDGSQSAVAAATGAVVPLIPQSTLPSIVTKKPSWRLSIDQDLGDRTIGYISYNRGFKSGGFNVRDETNPPFKPEQLDAYEAGLKSQLADNRIRLNLAGFYYDYKNVQVARYTTTTVIYNGARARLYGLDLDGAAKLTDQLTLSGGLAYLHSEFVDFPNAVSSSFAPGPGGTNIITLFTKSASGNRLPYSPQLTYNASIDYVVPTSVGELAFNFTDSYSSSYFAEPDNLLRQKAYHFLNASVGWTSSDKKFNLRVYINNILDKAVSSQFGSLATGYEADYPNPPRIYGARFGVSF